MIPYILDWANLLLRWLHVIVGIAWIGSSFYFVWLDNSLYKPDNPELLSKGVGGELWAVHGGGFYNPQKYLLAPKKLPEHLHWFYWEAYSTWLSGFALLAVLYLFNANTYLIDRQVFDMSSTLAVILAVSFLVAGWLIYDLICRIFGQRQQGDRTVALLVMLYVAFASWLACHLFAGRAAYLLVGAMIATIMSANVFFWIIPGQRKVVASMKAGQTPDSIHGKIGKQRSVHNTYFTLPVLFSMLSNHYSMTYAHAYNWLILIIIMAASMPIRQFFILKHKGVWNWWYPTVGSAMLLGVAVAIAPAPQPMGAAAEAPTLASIKPIVAQRCVMCHNAQIANKQIRLDSDADLIAHSQLIYQQVLVTRAMPMNNSTGMLEEERLALGRWAKSAQAK
ncbi:MAG: urate hydroxylase PuuD [Hylemonella sp.]